MINNYYGKYMFDWISKNVVNDVIVGGNVGLSFMNNYLPSYVNPLIFLFLNIYKFK